MRRGRQGQWAEKGRASGSPEIAPIPKEDPPLYPPSVPAHMVLLCHQTAERPPPSVTLPLPGSSSHPLPAPSLSSLLASKASQFSAAVSPSLCPHSDSQLHLRGCPPISDPRFTPHSQAPFLPSALPTS